MAQYSYEQVKDGYTQLWDQMTVTRENVARAAARRIVRNKDRYQAAAVKCGVPWFVIGCIHTREADGNFETYLGNGDPLHEKSTHIPRGRGPFASWEDGAYDALVLIENLDDVPYTGIEGCAYAFEKINGWGYRYPGRSGRSPYLWAGTNLQLPGKFVEDNKYSATTVDQQIGAMAVIRAIMDIDQDAAAFFDPKPAPNTTGPEPSPPVAPEPPRSPRADDTESEVKPVIKSKTIWAQVSLFLAAVGDKLVAIRDFILTPEGAAITVAFLGFATFLLYVGIKGRLDVQKVIKHLAQDS